MSGEGKFRGEQLEVERKQGGWGSDQRQNSRRKSCGKERAVGEGAELGKIQLGGSWGSLTSMNQWVSSQEKDYGWAGSPHAPAYR